MTDWKATHRVIKKVDKSKCWSEWIQPTGQDKEASKNRIIKMELKGSPNM